MFVRRRLRRRRPCRRRLPQRQRRDLRWEAASAHRIVWRHLPRYDRPVRQASVDRQLKCPVPPLRCKGSTHSRWQGIQDRGRIWPPVCTFRVMRILVSNDDGIYSPGIAALAEVASEFGTVRVVAPDVERSSASHAITSTFPMSYRPTRVSNLTAYRVNGTPADCVSLGAHHAGPSRLSTHAFDDADYRSPAV